MTTAQEVLALAYELPGSEGEELLVSYERWFHRRGDRQAARYWASGDREFAALAADNYADAKTLRAAIKRADFFQVMPGLWARRGSASR